MDMLSANSTFDESNPVSLTTEPESVETEIHQDTNSISDESNPINPSTETESVETEIHQDTSEATENEDS